MKDSKKIIYKEPKSFMNPPKGKVKSVTNKPDMKKVREYYGKKGK